MKLAVPAAEAGAGEEAEPELAGERGAHEARGLARREAEEDLLDNFGRQRRCRCRRRHCGWRRRGFVIGEKLEPVSTVGLIWLDTDVVCPTGGVGDRCERAAHINPSQACTSTSSPQSVCAGSGDGYGPLRLWMPATLSTAPLL
jgi:hypothetical protein